MGQIVNFGREMIRINSEKNRIEYSTNGGNSWHSRYSGSNAGKFYSLCIYGNELLACTSKGVYYSNNGGNSWHSRYSGSNAGEFEEITVQGNELLAQTSKGLYYSKNDGISWHRR
ncbi:WD40/YVTN/BNR-like repeat-containing protein [Segatella salivae]